MLNIPIKETGEGRVRIACFRSDLGMDPSRRELLQRECIAIKHSVEPWPSKDHCGFWRRDIRRRLPFGDQIADWIHVYHVFEHLKPRESQLFICELRRVLKVGGILRVSIQDHESHARDYLGYLEQALVDPTPENILNYEWMLIRFIDQMVRDKRSGRIGDLLGAGRYDRAFLRKHFGDVLNNWSPSKNRNGRRKLLLRPRHLLYAAWRRLRRVYYAQDPRTWGECDRWANDRVYMRSLAKHAGFRRFSRKTFDVSEIPDWRSFDLDRSIYCGDREFEPSAYFEYVK